jgi:hypothetical protein
MKPGRPKKRHMDAYALYKQSILEAQKASIAAVRAADPTYDVSGMMSSLIGTMEGAVKIGGATGAQAEISRTTEVSASIKKTVIGGRAATELTIKHVVESETKIVVWDDPKTPRTEAELLEIARGMGVPRAQLVVRREEHAVGAVFNDGTKVQLGSTAKPKAAFSGQSFAGPGMVDAGDYATDDDPRLLGLLEPPRTAANGARDAEAHREAEKKEEELRSAAALPDLPRQFLFAKGSDRYTVRGVDLFDVEYGDRAGDDFNMCFYLAATEGSAVEALALKKSLGAAATARAKDLGVIRNFCARGAMVEWEVLEAYHVRTGRAIGILDVASGRGLMYGAPRVEDPLTGEVSADRWTLPELRPIMFVNVGLHYRRLYTMSEHIDAVRRGVARLR